MNNQKLVFLIVLITSLHCSPQSNTKGESTTKKKAPVVMEYKADSINIVAVGDIMMGTNYPDNSTLPPKDAFLLQPVQQFLQAGDIVFGNLEGPVLDSGGSPKACGDPTSCYVFRQPSYFVKELKDAGFTMFSIANNHVGDLGEQGRVHTASILKQYNIRYAGQTNCPWDTLKIKGVLVGLTAFAPNKGCLNINDYKELEQVVKKLNTFCDIVIVSFHGGAEGQSHTHITRTHEQFLGQDRGDVYEFAHKAIDAGADIVLGHGPHITRAVDYYKGRFIAYSMGNFCTYDKFNINGISGMAPIFSLNVSKKGEFLSGKVIPTRQFDRGGPVYDSSASVIKEIQRLTKEDIPEVQLILHDSGEFSFHYAK